jgi:hypothetical protein
VLRTTGAAWQLAIAIVVVLSAEELADGFDDVLGTDAQEFGAAVGGALAIGGAGVARALAPAGGAQAITGAVVAAALALFRAFGAVLQLLGLFFGSRQLQAANGPKRQDPKSMTKHDRQAYTALRERGSARFVSLRVFGTR